MLVLGIDTSTRAGTFCIYDETLGILSQIKVEVALNHSDTIMKAVNELFCLSGIDKKRIEMIAVGIGPGSFTGIRVGMGVAKGLAYSMGVDIRGINTLDALAENGLLFQGKIIPMIDARHGRVFYAEYLSDGKSLRRVSDYKDDEVEKICKNSAGENILFLGDGAIKNKEIIEANCISGNLLVTGNINNSINSGLICEIALRQKNDNIYNLEPCYVAKSQAERVKKAVI